MFKYSINLSWSDEDECYVATVPEFPGLSAFGDTPDEAAKEAEIAAKGFIAVYEEDGDLLPEPLTVVEYSGQTRLRLAKSLHAALAQEAKREKVSLNTYINTLLSERNSLSKIMNKFSVLESLLYGHVFENGQKQQTETAKTLNVTQENHFFDFDNVNYSCQ